MANVNIWQERSPMPGLMPGPGVIDSYYQVQAEQRHILQQIVAFGGGWFWYRPENILFQSAKQYQNVTYIASDMTGKPLRYRRKSDRLSSMDRAMLSFCFMRF